MADGPLAPDPPAPYTPEWLAACDNIAVDALKTTILGDLDTAVAELLVEAVRLGGRPVDRMMFMWADTLLHHIGLPDHPESDVPVHLQVLASGTLDDHPTLEALLADAGGSYTQRVIAVLTGVAATLREHRLRDCATEPVSAAVPQQGGRR